MSGIPGKKERKIRFQVTTSLPPDILVELRVLLAKHKVPAGAFVGELIIAEVQKHIARKEAIEKNEFIRKARKKN